MPTCFYCLGKHQTSQCLTRATDRTIVAEKETKAAIEQLGHQSLEQIQQFTEVGTAIVSGLEDIKYAINELQGFMGWAHSETMWALEKQIEILTGVHDMIKNPRATEANELYLMAEDSFKRSRFDDALRLLNDARQLNPGDYRIHITMGFTYLQKNELEKALDSFKTACDYARTKVYKRDALLLLARTQRCLRHHDDACTAIRQAIELDSAYPAARYELASTIAASGE